MLLLIASFPTVHRFNWVFWKDSPGPALKVYCTRDYLFGLFFFWQQLLRCWGRSKKGKKGDYSVQSQRVLFGLTKQKCKKKKSMYMFALTFSGKSPSPACYPAQQVLLVKWYHSQGWRPLEKKKKKKKKGTQKLLYTQNYWAHIQPRRRRHRRSLLNLKHRQWKCWDKTRVWLFFFFSL